MVIRYLTKQEVEEDRFLIWNEFVDILTMEEYNDLDGVQRVAYLCFWYDNEVQNGGHLQYLENRGLNFLAESIIALNEIGAATQAEILKSAVEKFSSKPGKQVESAEQYIERALGGEFDAVDTAYYQINPSVSTLLEKYLQQNIDHFIKIG